MDIFDCWPPKSPFAQRGAMCWSELAPLLRRNRSYHAEIRINFYPRLHPDIVTVMDWHLPEMAVRTGAWDLTRDTKGNHHLEAEALSVVCNTAWLGGECPMDDLPGLLAKDHEGKDTTKVLRKPYRGVRELIRHGLHMKSLRETVEVGLLLGNWEMVRRCWGRDE